MTVDYSEIKCTLCNNELMLGALFAFVQCKQCGNISHDACWMWRNPSVSEKLDMGYTIYHKYCKNCGGEKQEQISPELWFSPDKEIVTSDKMWIWKRKE